VCVGGGFCGKLGNKAAWETLVPEEKWTPRTVQFWVLAAAIVGVAAYNHIENKKRKAFVPFSGDDGDGPTQTSGPVAAPVNKAALEASKAATAAG
jgi:hypothetical protein